MKMGMTGSHVRRLRKLLGLTQQQAASRWRVSQPYLSLMERGRRPVPERLTRRLARREPRLATAVPARVLKTGHDLPTALGALGYPGFAYLADSGVVSNPASVVLSALKAQPLAARVAEALPWVLVTFSDLDWEWLVTEAKLANAQNRLGYLVTLASHLMHSATDRQVVDRLEGVRQQLEDARLAKEDTLGRELTETEREFARRHRPAAAAHWNLLTTLRVTDLRYAP
jgi:transcriptional regulator with XRE-family HTH domain